MAKQRIAEVIAGCYSNDLREVPMPSVDRPLKKVLVDSIMPVLSGLGMVNAMKTDPARAHIPVMLMSGSPALAHGASVPVLREPFGVDDLLRNIEKMIGPP